MKDKQVFDNYSLYYDLLYSDKEYDREVKYIDNLLQSYSIKGNRLLEFGSGTGIHGNKLALKGYEVFGIELSQEMVNIAQQNKRFQCKQGDMTSSEVHGEFDAVLSLFHVVSYLTTKKQLYKFFSNCSRNLSKGGLLIFDLWYTPAVEFSPPELRIKKMKNNKLDVIRLTEPTIDRKNKCVDVNFTIFSKKSRDNFWIKNTETHKMRHFSKKEIYEAAKRNNFTLLRNEEFLTSRPLSKETWGACFVFKKNKN